MHSVMCVCLLLESIQILLILLVLMKSSVGKVISQVIYKLLFVTEIEYNKF